MIYKDNLNYYISRILAPYELSPITSEAERMSIAHYLQVSFYMKHCSEIIEAVDTDKLISKSKIRNDIGFYIPHDERWHLFTGRFADFEYYKHTVKELCREIEDDLPVDVRVNFVYMYNGKYDSLPYKKNRSFRDAHAAIDNLDTNITTLEELINDAYVFQLLVLNEIERRCGRKYALAEDIVKIHETYEHTEDIAEVANLKFYESTKKPMSKSESLLQDMGWTII